MYIRKILSTLVLTLAAFAFPSVSHAWTCPTGQRWVQVPSGTTGARIVEGIPFQCQAPPPPVDPSTKNSASSTSSSSSSATASQSQGQNQGQGQGQSQGQGQTANGGDASNGGQANSQSTNYTSIYKQVRQAPMAYAPDAIPSAPCRASASGGASSPFGGLALGGSKLDQECDLRETARAFALIGNTSAAARVLCETKGAKKAKLNISDCDALVAPPTVQVTVVPPPVQFIVPEEPVTVPYIVEPPITVIAPKAKHHKSHTCPKTPPVVGLEK
jgi:hypothetical protein